MAEINASAIPFSFESHTIRAINRDGEIWFIANDVCGALDIKNPRDALSSLDDDEKGVANTDTLGGQQKMSIINESGLYALVLRSRKPEAKKFRKWVTSEVLPAIRKTGSYSLTINKAQQGELATLIRERFEPKQLAYAWSRFNNHFRLASYKDLPASRFNEALEYTKNIPLKSKNATPSDETFPRLREIAREYIKKAKNGEDAKIEIPDDVLAGLASLYLTTNTFRLSFDWDGNIQLCKQPNPYEGLSKAIADPSNIGLETEKITEVLNACVTALNYRAQKARRLTN